MWYDKFSLCKRFNNQANNRRRWIIIRPSFIFRHNFVGHIYRPFFSTERLLDVLFFSISVFFFSFTRTKCKIFNGNEAWKCNFSIKTNWNKHVDAFYYLCKQINWSAQGGSFSHQTIFSTIFNVFGKKKNLWTVKWRVLKKQLMKWFFLY